MYRSRLIPLILIFAVWFSTTGFMPSTQNRTVSPLDPAVSSAGPALQTTASFGKIYPVNNATGVPSISLTLQWGAVQNYTGTVTYRYCLTQGNKKNCPPGKWVRVGSALSATVSNLTANTTYKWWVRAYNNQGLQIAEADNASWTFTTMNVPGNFGKLSPSINSSNITPGTVALTWGTSATATSYQYCIDTTNNSICDTSWVTASSGITPPGLLSNTIYYWQVRALNSGGATLADTGTWWPFTTVIMPGIFSKLAPTANATGQPINGTVLSWNISSSATGYQYCLSLTNNTCSGTWQPISVTSVTLGTLNYSTDYYWQVRASTSAGTVDANGGTWWKFTTQAPPPENFVKYAPATGLNNVYTDVTFTWLPSNGADSYEFCLVALNIDTTCGGMPWDAVSGTSYTVLGLDVGTIYYWQVRAINATGTREANTGTWWSFTTQPNPPLDFTKATPISGSSRTNTSLTLIWSQTLSTGVTYQICYDTTDDSICDQDAWHTVLSGNSYPVSGLNNGTTYYWQVRATNGGGTTYADYDMTSWWSFTTALAAPQAFNKTNLSAGPQPLNLTLRWDPSSQGVTYEYCVSTSSESCVSPNNWVSTSSTSAIPAGLTYGTTYYWQVRARNVEDLVTEANGGWWSFTTALAAPLPFNKTSPDSGPTPQPLNLNLQWEANGTVASYEVCYDTTPDSACDQENWHTVTTGTSYSPTDLINSTVYYWQVRAKNSEGTATAANDGTWWSFTTMLPKPANFSKSTPTDGRDLQALDLTLQWDPSDPNVSYAVCYDISPDAVCDQNNWHAVVSGTSYQPSDLANATTYYWQVRAVNSEGTTTLANNGDWWRFTTRPATPQPKPFYKNTPQNGAEVQPLDLTLGWDGSDEGVTYEYCVSTSRDMCISPNNWVSTSSTSAAPADLTYNTTYYWQVRATNAGGTTIANDGTWWSFTTMLARPDDFSKANPSNGDEMEPLNLALQWDATNGAASYEVCYYTTDAQTCALTENWHVVNSGTEYHPTDLVNGMLYHWQVRAKNSQNSITNANTGAWWTFTTMLPEPKEFSKTSPSIVDGNQPLNLTLQWEASDLDAEYEYCVSSVSGSCVSEQGWVKTSSTSAVPAGLDYGTTYYWQVYAINSQGTTRAANGGEWWSFTTRISAPAPFGKSAPTIDTKTDVQLTLSWTPSTTPGAAYAVCVDQSDDGQCENEDWKPATTQGTFEISGLNPAATYYWQVRANNAGGDTFANDGTWWRFTTMLPKPKGFDKSGPTDGSDSMPIAFTLQWLASDQDARYEVCYDMSSDGACDNNNWRQVTSGLTYDFIGLNYATTYYWQVRALNSEDTSTEANNGSWWQFTTYSEPPKDFVKMSPANGDRNQVLNTTLRWSPAGEGFTYEYCYGTTLPLRCANWSATDATSAQLSNLFGSTKYYWQVRAKDSSGHTTEANDQVVWEFTTRPVPPTSRNEIYNDLLEDQPFSGSLLGADQYTFTLTTQANTGNLTLQPNGHFTYTPSQNFSGPVTFQFTVSDGINDAVGPYTVTLNYLPVNDPPLLNPISVPGTVLSGKTVTFTATGSDLDLGMGEHLTFAIDRLPAGATFDANTGIFRWVPTWSRNGSNVYQFTITVSDGHPNEHPSQQVITITVLPVQVSLPVIVVVR